MGYADSFYVIVKSTDSKLYFPSNTMADFYVKLPHQLNLDADWSVCVNQIWMDKMWHNISDAGIRIMAPPKPDGVKDEDYEPEKTVYLKNGYYPDETELASVLTSMAEINGEKACDFEFNAFAHKMVVHPTKNYMIQIGSGLAEILGTTKTVFKTKVLLESYPKLHSSDTLAYVHTDIISGPLTASTVSNILKILNTRDQNFGTVIYDNVISNYCKVVIDYFDVIHFQIKNTDNKIIKSEGGCTMIQLHFKRE